ncbi:MULTISPECIES: hypothetical protein [Nosocomiicoccus]|uniref:Uncharacterized protein n=1 Tax=Nosocomiicoccus massiliensis TaxID=1232430 RepID=A0AAF1BT22_9STAP|nr:MULTISPECIES: hypothetical protein [Nosocomiicoccus]MDK6862641.1 hypothetical protein [Nosocomiicoccus ampullae]OFL47054.1 hypothetical protein HMPREF2767_00550 [Nosocomiicoccus sp. HMSC067E10]OFO55489.1 hypothetical protein HMPREF3029_04345 [Nosocomiicoccus sp. HMSC059G07]WOS96487.1 hypothetical protein CJ229_001715 [Nosocomiicoccus massiliensis]
MKKSLYIGAISLCLVACSPENLNEKYEEKSNRVKQLEKELHSVEVENQKLKDDFKNIEEEISRISRDKKDTNISKYQNVVRVYANGVKKELDVLSIEAENFKEEEDIDGRTVSNIESNLKEIINTYNSDVDELKLQDMLNRQHNKIEVFNSNLLKEINTLNEAIGKDDKKNIEKQLNKIKDLNKYL